MSQHKITTDPARLAPESEPAQTLQTQPWRRTTAALYLLEKEGGEGGEEDVETFTLFQHQLSFIVFHFELIVILLAVLFVGLDCPAVLMLC